MQIISIKHGVVEFRQMYSDSMIELACGGKYCEDNITAEILVPRYDGELVEKSSCQIKRLL